MSRTTAGDAYTWDGLPVSSEPPYGAMIVVYRRAGQAVEFLLLHRGHHGPDDDGEWAWGPPAGARCPGEPIEACAARELLEETGLCPRLTPVAGSIAAWPVYLAEAPQGAPVRLSAEHDGYAWLPLDEAAERVAPAVVRDGLLAAARLVVGKNER